MKLILVNDLHLASRGPSTRVDNFHWTVDRKLDFVGQTAADEKVDAICVAGDIFHATTLAYAAGDYAPMTYAIKRFREWQRERPVLVIPGNHDLPNNRIDDLPKSAFGALLAAHHVTPVWRAPWKCQDGGWVGGVPYPATEEQIKSWQKYDGPGLLMIHSFASLNGGDVFGERSFGYIELAQWLPNVVVFHFGHDHKDHGVQSLGNQTFVQVGALVRGTLADDQIYRQPKLVVVDIQGAKPLVGLQAAAAVKVIDVPIEPPEKVFDLEKKEKVDTVSDEINAFVEHLGDVTSRAQAGVAVDLSTLQISDAARARVETYLKMAAGAK